MFSLKRINIPFSTKNNEHPNENNKEQSFNNDYLIKSNKKFLQIDRPSKNEISFSKYLFHKLKSRNQSFLVTTLLPLYHKEKSNIFSYNNSNMKYIPQLLHKNKSHSVTNQTKADKSRNFKRNPIKSLSIVNINFKQGKYTLDYKEANKILCGKYFTCSYMKTKNNYFNLNSKKTNGIYNNLNKTNYEQFLPQIKFKFEKGKPN